MKLIQLQYFRAICKHSSITKAASELHISQPSLSNTIKELENEFGFSLFYRLSKGLALTEEGKLFLQEATQLLEHADHFVAEMQDLGSAKRDIKLGVPPMIATLVFPQLFGTFHETFPNFKLAISENGTLTNKSKVLDGTLDAAVISCEAPLSSAFGFHDLGSVGICFYVSREHALAAHSGVSLADIADIPLAFLAEDSFLTHYIRQCFKAQQLTPNVIINTNQLAAIGQLVEHNMAAAFLFDGILPAGQTIAKLPVNGLPEIKIRLIWNAGRKLSPGTQNLIRLAKRTYK